MAADASWVGTGLADGQLGMETDKGDRKEEVGSMTKGREGGEGEGDTARTGKKETS